MTQKQQAYASLKKALEALRTYRGLPNTEVLVTINKNETIAKIESSIKAVEVKMNEPIPSASAKQLALIERKSKTSFTELARLMGHSINKYQASEIISLIITTEEMMRSKYDLSKEDFNKVEDSMRAIIDIIVSN